MKNFPAHLFMAAVALAPSFLSAATPEERGREIAVIADQANTGFKGESATMSLQLINAHGDVIDRKMTMRMKEGISGGDKSVFAFNWPADVNGTKLLTWTHKDRDDDQWLYLPAIKRVKRISSSGKSGSFMGSEFAYEDLSAQEVDKYTYKFIEEVELDGRKTWVTERYPTDKNSGYSKTKNWTDQEYKNVVKIEFYDRKGELMKTANFKGYKKYGEFWRFDSIEMANRQTRKRSIMRWEDRKLGIEFNDRDFETSALEE